MVFGWAYQSKAPDGTVYVDKQGDFIDDDTELEKAAYDFVLDHRTGDVMHDGVAIASIVESVVFTDEKLAKMGVPTGILPTGWWVGFKVHDDTTWKLVKKRHLRAFSIGGRGIRQKVDD